MAADAILITFEALLVPRAADPVALDEAPAALRRIGWIGRPVVIAGTRAGDRQLPVEPSEREALVRSVLGEGDYRVASFEPLASERGTDAITRAAERWGELREAQDATWLLTHASTEVGLARRGGLKVILIGPSDGDPGAARPDHQARDVRDAIGYLLAIDVFEAPFPA
jgi:hypothetical protein